MKITRALLPATLAGALLMTGCSGDGDAAADAANCVDPGAASDSIEVSGTVGDDLELTSTDPLVVSETERTVLQEGEGDQLKDGQSIGVAMSMFNGDDGSVLQARPESSVPYTEDSLVSWAYAGLSCASTGEQVAVVTPYAEVFGETAPEDTGYENLTEETPIVVVMEFGEITEGTDEVGTLEPDELLEKAEGTAEEAPDGFPSVKLAKSGEPEITMPKGEDAPEKLSIATLITGDGEEVAEGDRVYVNYKGVIWRTGEVFDSSWERGEATSFLTNEVIGGFSQALVGQTVGSQVISVVPAEDGGYGAAQLESMGHQGDDVMVFVLDIVGVVHADAAAE